MTTSQPILGAIMAGGAASRFGSDKALALFEGRPLIDHVAQALADQAAAVIVVGHWPSSLADHLQDWLAADQPRAVRRWAAAVGARAVTLDHLPTNVNTRADLDTLRR